MLPAIGPTVGAAVILIFTVSLAAKQGPLPSGSLVVKISRAKPAAISEAEGV